MKSFFHDKGGGTCSRCSQYIANVNVNLNAARSFALCACTCFECHCGLASASVVEAFWLSLSIQLLS
jgi:hypothetical protein